MFQLFLCVRTYNLGLNKYVRTVTIPVRLTLARIRCVSNSGKRFQRFAVTVCLFAEYVLMVN